MSQSHKLSFGSGDAAAKAQQKFTLKKALTKCSYLKSGKQVWHSSRAIMFHSANSADLHNIPPPGEICNSI